MLRSRSRMRTVNRLNRIGGGGGATPSLASRLTALLGGDASFWLPGPEWFFTDAAKTVPCTDTDTIRVWADGSGNGRDFAQATSAMRPTARLIDGVWRAVFDGVDDWLVGSTFPTAVSDAFLAVPMVRDTNNGPVWRFPSNADDPNDYIEFAGGVYLSFGTTVRKGPFAPSPAIDDSVLYHEVRSSATEWSYWCRGDLVSTTATNTRPTWRADPTLGGIPGSTSNAQFVALVYCREALDDLKRSALASILTEVY
jgi:hypothetical protein